MLLDKFQYLLGDTGVGADVAAIHLPLAQLFHLCILGWHDANGDLRRLAEVRTIECNRRNRPTPQSLPGFLAQALEEPIFHRIAPSATLPAGVASLTRSPRRRGIENCRALIDQISAALSAEEPAVNVSSAAELLFYLESGLLLSKSPRVSLMAWARGGDCAWTSPRSLDEL